MHFYEKMYYIKALLVWIYSAGSVDVLSLRSKMGDIFDQDLYEKSRSC